MRTCSTSSADVLKQTQIYTVEGEERDLQEYDGGGNDAGKV